MNIFEESIVILKSKVKIRALLKQMHIEDIESMITRLQSVYEEKLEEAKNEEEANLHKQAALQEIMNILKEKNISPEELSYFYFW